jgi:hypothetical protein
VQAGAFVEAGQPAAAAAIEHFLALGQSPPANAVIAITATATAMTNRTFFMPRSPFMVLMSIYYSLSAGHIQIFLW